MSEFQNIPDPEQQAFSGAFMDLPPADPDPTDEEAVDHMIGENKQLSEALEQAGIDSLTGFLTKDAFMKKIDGIFGMSGMSGSDDRRPVPNSQVVAVIFADVTGLKQTNEHLWALRRR